MGEKEDSEARIYPAGDTFYDIDADASATVSPTIREATRKYTEEEQIERSRETLENRNTTKRTARRMLAKSAIKILDLIEIVVRAYEKARENKDSLAGALERVCIALVVFFWSKQEYMYLALAAMAIVILYFAKIRFGEGPIIAKIRAKLEKTRRPQIRSTKTYIAKAWLTQHIEGDDG